MPTEPAPTPQPAIKTEPIQNILAPISLGELIDKITILEIKSDRIADVDKLKNVKHELSVLSATRDAHLGGIDGLSEQATQ